MGGEQTQPMWVLLILLLVRPARSMCPARCRCNDNVLQAYCMGAGLEVVPIQLNPEVRYIDLSQNKITTIHLTLSFYYHLVSLNFSTNKLQTIGSLNFESQHNLKHLNISSNEVESLSKDSLKGLQNLTDLDLSFNRLEELVSGVFKDLHSLQILILSNNQLISLEEGLFSHAVQLRELFLDDNQLLELPGLAIGTSNNLHFLSLSRNLIETIEDGDVPKLTNLRVLILDTNIINNIHPNALTGLINLEYLDLNDNNFTIIPTLSLAKLSNLTKFHFSGNLIRSVPPVAFRGLFQLRYLRLERLDYLTNIDVRAFVDNINLEKLWLDDNIAIQKIPTRLLYGNPHVTYISIRNNRLISLEVSHFPLDQLKNLKLGGNPFECNCSLLWLWRLEQEQFNRKSSNDTDLTDLTIDIEHIRCNGPETLKNILLVEASESKVDCSLGWMTAVCVILFACLLLTTACVLLYFGPMRRRSNKRELPSRENAPHQDNTLTITYEDPRVDKYIIGTPLIHDYRALPTWDTFAKNHDMDIYRQFNSNVKTRPHIVYV